MDPLLKWVGSKRWQVEMIGKLPWTGGRLVELFAGSAAVSFGLEVEHALLNDANPHLFNFYKHFMLGDIVDLSGSTSEKEYYARREWFNRLVRDGKADSAMAAGLFYYLNCTGFNNLWRVNSRGEVNVPFRKGRESVPPLGAMPSKCWTFSNDDFRDVLLEPTDFVYADPPYLGTFEDYTAEGFSEFDFAELVSLLTGHPGRVVIMNSAHPMAIDICQSAGLHITLLESQQKMHNSRGRNDVVSELMATNFPLTGAV
jgi:DNA adenine methylase